MTLYTTYLGESICQPTKRKHYAAISFKLLLNFLWFNL
jgi:hypothetical protein